MSYERGVRRNEKGNVRIVESASAASFPRKRESAKIDLLKNDSTSPIGAGRFHAGNDESRVRNKTNVCHATFLLITHNSRLITFFIFFIFFLPSCTPTPPLTPEQEQSIEEILTEARQFYRDRGTISDGEWSVYLKTLEADMRGG